MHNSYLQWLVEFGVIGIVVPLVFVFRIIVKYAFKLPVLWRTDDNTNEKEVVLFSLLYCILFPFGWTIRNALSMDKQFYAICNL